MKGSPYEGAKGGGGKNIFHSKEINYLMPKCLMMERHFAWLRHLVYPRKYECVHECGMNASMNVYECVCESVSVYMCFM